jgi:hypothetical protein
MFNARDCGLFSTLNCMLLGGGAALAPVVLHHKKAHVHTWNHLLCSGVSFSFLNPLQLFLHLSLPLLSFFIFPSLAWLCIHIHNVKFDIN